MEVSVYRTVQSVDGLWVILGTHPRPDQIGFMAEIRFHESGWTTSRIWLGLLLGAHPPLQQCRAPSETQWTRDTRTPAATGSEIPERTSELSNPNIPR